MARLYTTDFEAGVDWTTTSGSPTIVTTVANENTHSHRFNPSGAAWYAEKAYASVTSGRRVFFRAYIYIASMPVADTIILANTDVTGASTGRTPRLFLRTTGRLQLAEGSGSSHTFKGTTSDVLNTGQWYRVEMDYNGPSADATTGYLDGVNFSGSIAGGSGFDSTGGIRWGAFTSTGNTTADIFFDSVAVNDSTTGSNNGLPGSVSTADVTAPSTPTGLTVTGDTSDSVSLSWTASTDNVAVTGYSVLRNGVEAGTTASTTFTDSGLTPSTAYTYTVKAYDAATNLSSASSSVIGTTDAAAPTVWTPPMTAVTNSLWTSAQFNTYIRDNMLATEGAKAQSAGAYFASTGIGAITQRSPSSAAVTTSQTRANEAYGDLTTVGPAVSVTTGTSALVWIQCELANNSSPDIPTVQDVITYAANGSSSFQAGGTNRGVSECYQGQYDGTNGNQYSMIAFPYATIQADLAGATIDLVELYLNNNHTYANSGGTAVIGTHNQTSVSGSHAYAQVNPDEIRWHFDKGQAKWVEIDSPTHPTGIGNMFRDNTAKGIALGKGPTTSTLYYGFYAGNGQSGEPQLRVTFSSAGSAGAWSKASFAVSGATTVAASDDWCVFMSGASANAPGRWGVCRRVTGLTPGSNTFTMKYAAGATGATGTFANREIIVLPL